MRVKTTVAHQATVGGAPDHQAGGILADERTSLLARGRGRGNLYVLVEVSGRAIGWDVIARQLTETVRDAYFRHQGSVTAGLQNALREANRLLFEENRNSLPGEQRTAGVSCAVLRDDDLFIAQVGPAAAYYAHAGQVTRLPDLSPWLDGLPPEEVDAVALGERRDIEVSLFHIPVSDDDTILLVDSATARRISSPAWPAILGQDQAQAVLDAMSQASKGGDLLALAVKVEIAEGKAASRPTAASAVSGSAAPPPSPPLGEQIARRLEPLRLGERLRTAGSTLAGGLTRGGNALLILAKRLIPGPPTSQPAAGRAETIGRTSSKKPKDRPRGVAAEGATHKILIGIALAIPLIVAAIALFAYIERGRARNAELEALWTEANDRWQQALRTTDPTGARALLTEAKTRLDQLLKRRPNHTQAADLRKRVEVLLDEIGHVQRITAVMELKSYPSSANLSRVVVEGVYIFVLDRQAGKVYRHQLDGTQQALTSESLNAVLVSRGDQVNNILVGDLVDMVWMPMGNDRQKAALVILESGGALVEYDPATGERTARRVAASETWQFPKLVGSYYGRFYLLDSSANKIWRYRPSGGGYSLPPDDWLETQIDLAGVVDMAIGNSIFLLYADGRIQKLTTGQPDTFAVSDWDTPPNSPSAIFTRPPDETQWIYIADRGNSRIVQCGTEGQFKRQLRLTDVQIEQVGDVLAGVTSLFVDEIGGRAYILSGRKLYLLALPD